MCLSPCSHLPLKKDRGVSRKESRGELSLFPPVRIYILLLYSFLRGELTDTCKPNLSQTAVDSSYQEKECFMNRKKSISYSLGIVIILAFLSLSLGGCDLPTFGGQAPAKKPTATSTTSQQPTTPSITSTDPTATSTPSGGPTSTATVGSSEKSCGTLYYQQAETNTGPIVSTSANSNAQQVASCFLQAFQQCTLASLDVNVSIGTASIQAPGNVRMLSTKLPTDGGPANLYHFSTKSQSGSCVVSEVEQAYSVSPTSSTSQTCVSVEQAGTDLRFVNCGNAGTLTFPLVQTTPTP